MKIVKQSVSIIPQEPGVVGMKKHIERVSRISYRSEDRITEDSYIRFIDMLYKRGHWACFNLGTVYLKVPIITDVDDMNIVNKMFNTKDKRMAWNKRVIDDSYMYITTNYRVICQLKAEDFMNTYWCEPTENHYHKVTSHWVTTRSIAQQVLRHKVFTPIMESTRYCNYSITKFNGEVVFAYPCWADDEFAKLGCFDEFFEDADEKWNYMVGKSELVTRRDAKYKADEEEYLWEVANGLKPEDARDALGMGLKTEFCMCGYVEDYCEVPEDDLPEKCGFFYLRTAADAQRDVRVLSEDLKSQFSALGLDKLK